jgi:hypothetical protein
MRNFQRQYREEHGIGYALALNPEKRRSYRRAQRRQWVADHPEEWAARSEALAQRHHRDAKRRRADRAERRRQRMQLIVHPGPYSVLPAKHPVMLISLIQQQQQDRRNQRGHHKPKAKLFIGGTCARCGKPFITCGRSRPKYCSDACLNATCKDNRRAVEHEPYRRIDIFKRDGWRCHICGRQTRRDVSFNHALAPTVDHLIPVSQGGRDAPDNVACAHRHCNSVKGARGTTQLLLVG